MKKRNPKITATEKGKILAAVRRKKFVAAVTPNEAWRIWERFNVAAWSYRNGCE